MVLGVVPLRQLEDGLVGLLGKPHHGGHSGALSPAHRPEQPRCGYPGERRSGCTIQKEGGIRVPLKKRGCHLVVDLAFDCPAHDVGFVLAGGKDQYLPGLEDRLHAHGDRFAGDVLLPEEVSRRVFPGDQVQGHHPGAALGSRARLVEADVAGSSYAQDLKVDSAGGPDGVLVPLAFGLDLLPWKVAPEDVDIGRQDIQLVEQILPHEPVVGVNTPRVHRVVLVQVEGDHVPEGQSLLLVHPNELPVNSNGRGAGREPEHGLQALGLAGADHLRDPAGHPDAHLVVIVHDHGRNSLERLALGQRR
jgi:hypothetical protein